MTGGETGEDSNNLKEEAGTDKFGAGTDVEQEDLETGTGVDGTGNSVPDEEFRTR